MIGAMPAAIDTVVVLHGRGSGNRRRRRDVEPSMRVRPMLLGLALCVGCSATTANRDRSADAAQSPKDALAQTLDGLSGVIRSASLGPGPSGVPDTDGLWVHVQVTAEPPAPIQRMEGDWEAALLAGAVADRTAGDGQLGSVIKGLIVDHVATDSTIESGWQPTPNKDVAAGQRFQAPGDDQLIRQLVTDTLSQYNAQPVSIEVLHPLDAALKVVATIETPEALNGRLAQLQSVLTGTPVQFEGVYLELRLPDGGPIAVLSTAFRAVQGSQSVRPDLEDILGGPPHG
jgi:hypothetical protein